jgi:hypothetical protein
MTACFTKYSGSPFADPPFGTPEAARQWFNWMQGLLPRTGGSFIHPSMPNQPTKFWMDGDPVANTGRLDLGVSSAPGDRRMGPSIGPFMLLPGQSKDVAIAVASSIGSSNIKSVAVLRSYARAARTMYEGIMASAPPKLTASVSYPNATQARVQIVADGRPTSAQVITTQIFRQTGEPVTVLPLFDDGFHSDGAANDGIWGNSVTLDREQTALRVNATTVDSLQRTFNWERMYDKLTVSGPLRLEYRVVSDNLNNDGIVNWGENIRYGISIVNTTPFVLGGIVLAPLFQTETKFIRRNGRMPGGLDSMIYNPNDTLSYFSFTTPDSSEKHIPFLITDSLYNAWRYSLTFPIQPMKYKQHRTEAMRAAGNADGEFNVLVVDLERIRPDRYVIRIVDSINAAGETGFTLKDSTDGRILLFNHPLPDSLGHTIHVTDGFKVLLNHIAKPGMKNWDIPHGIRRWTWTNADGLRLEGFNGAMGMGYRNWFSSSSVRPAKLHNVLIKLAATDVNGNLLNPNDTTASYGYRYLRRANAPPAQPEFAPFIINSGSGYAFQDYRRGSVPFSAYDLEAGGRRLMVGFLENNVPAGLVDGKYWPPYIGQPIINTSEDGPREFFFIFSVPYSVTPNPSLQVDIQGATTPLMWFGTPNRRFNDRGFQQNDEFLILASHVLSSEDVWVFSLDSIAQNFLPTTFALSQNFPNPFNPTTTINYKLPVESKVTMKVYNILGQQVATLVDATQVLGFYSVQWNSRNASDNAVATGVYFYRIEAKSVGNRGNVFTQVKKMLLLR